MFGDIYFIADRIRGLNDNFDIHYNEQTRKYTITHKGHHFMTVQLGQLDDRVMKHIEKTVWLNKKAMLEQEIEEHNAKILKEQEKHVSDMAYQMAKDIRKPLLRHVEGW